MSDDLHSCIGEFPSDITWRKNWFNSSDSSYCRQIGMMHRVKGGLRIFIFNEAVSGKSKGMVEIFDEESCFVTESDEEDLKKLLLWGEIWE